MPYLCLARSTAPGAPGRRRLRCAPSCSPRRAPPRSHRRRKLKENQGYEYWTDVEAESSEPYNIYNSPPKSDIAFSTTQHNDDCTK